MAQLKIDIGVQGNDGTGDSIRTSFNKVNQNFSELYAIFGGGGTIKFTNLSDAPSSYKANQVIMASTTGGSLSARTLEVGDPTSGGQFAIDTTDPTKLIIRPPQSNLQLDAHPTLGGFLNARGAFSMVNLVEPSQALVDAFNNDVTNKTAQPPIQTTLDSFAISKGYADKNYLKVINGQISDALNVRNQPLTPQVGVPGYDATLSGNYLATEAVQRQDVVLRGGDTMTGPLTLSDHPSPLSGVGIVASSDDLQAASKYYVDNNTFYSGVNLYVTTKGDDLQTNTPPGREGRAWHYAYKSIGAAALQAENLLNLSSLEPGPYRQTISYTVGPNQYDSTIVNDAKTQKHLVGLTNGSIQDQGYLDAASLLAYNREFIQRETIAYINKKYVNKFEFDQSRWGTIITDIINGVAYDLALGTTFNSTTQGSKLFSSYNTDIITNNLSQITDAVTQIRDKILDYSYDINSNTALEDYVSRIIYALCYDFALGSNYQSIQAGLYYPYASNTLTATIPDFSESDVVSLLDTSTITITGTSGDSSTATILFNTQTSAPFTVGERILVSGVSTTGYNSSASNTGYWTVLTCTTTYVTFACPSQGASTGGVISKHNLINNIIADISNASITGSLKANAALITEIILTGVTPTPEFPIASATTGFTYNSDLCARDVGIIINAVLDDLIFDTNFKSITAAFAYLRSYSSVVPADQKKQTIAGLNFARDQAVALVANNLLAVAAIKASFATITTIIDNVSTVGAPAITFTNPLNVTTGIVNGGQELIANREFLIDETIAYIDANLTPGSIPNYTEATCRRDLGYIIDALTFDLLYGGNTSSLVAVNAYYNYNATINTISTEIAATASAYTHLQSIIGNVITANTSWTPLQSVSTQSTTAGVGNSTAATTVNGLLTFIIDVINNGMGNDPSIEYPTYANGVNYVDFNASRNTILGNLTVIKADVITFINDNYVFTTGQVSAATLLLSNIGYIQAEISGFLTSNFASVSYDRALSKRDVKTIIWSLVYDLTYGGNSQSTYAGSRYWDNNGVSYLTSSAETGACIGAINYIGLLAKSIITNTAPETQYQQTVFQYTNETYQNGGNAIVTESIANNVAIITDLIVNGAATINSTTGVFGDAPTSLPTSGILYSGFNIITNPISGKVDDLKTISKAFISSSNGLIDNSLFGTINDGPTVNSIYAKFNVILNLLKYGVNNATEPRPQVVYADTTTDSANQAREAILSNMEFLKANINAYIGNLPGNIVFDAAATATDIQSVIEAVVYDIQYGGRSATADAALQYWHNGTFQLTAGFNDTATGAYYLAFVELQNEITDILNNNGTITVYPGNNLTQSPVQTVTWAQAHEQVDTIVVLFGMLRDILAAYQSTSVASGVRTITAFNTYTVTTPSLVHADVTLYHVNQPRGAWNIITGAATSINSYVLNYLAVTYTGGYTYNETLCFRDLGTIIDAIIIDIMTGTQSVPSNYQAVNCGKSFYKNASALKVFTSTPSLDGLLFAEDLTLQVLHQVEQLRYQSLYTQNSYYGNVFSVDSSKAPTVGAINQVSSEFGTILNIVRNGLGAAGQATVGSGYYTIQFKNGGQSAVDQGQALDNHIIPGKILIGNTSGASGVILSYTPGGSLTYDTIKVNMLQPGFFIPGETLDYAESVSVQHITIRVETGIYYEDYPIRMAANVTIKGDDFRRTLIRPIDRVSKSPWVRLFFYRDGIFDGMQIGPIDYSQELTAGYSSSITLSGTTGTITATLASGQVPASWAGLVLTESNFTVTSGYVYQSVGDQYCRMTFVDFAGNTLGSDTAPYAAGDSIIISGMSPTTYNGTFVVSSCSVTDGVGTVTFVNNQAVGTANVYGQISTGKAVIDSVSGNVMNLTVVYPFTNAGVILHNDWHLYTTSNYGRHYLENPLDINSTPKNNKNIDVFLVNDATRISNVTAQGHGGFMMVLDPEGQIKSKSPYAQEAASFAGSINAKRFAGGQLIDGMAGRLFGTVVNVDSYPPNAVATGTIAGNTMTITSMTAGTFIYGLTTGMSLSGQGITGTPIVQLQISGTPGGVGTYQISTTQSINSPIEITGSNGTANTLITIQGVVNSGIDIRAPQVPCSFYLEGYRYQIDQVYDYHSSVQVGLVTYASGGAVGSFSFTVDSTNNLAIGQYISGTGIPGNANPAVYITGISGNTITLSNTNFINGVAWTGLTAQASGTYAISAPQTRLILDTSTPFTAVSSYNSISSYFENILSAVKYDAALGTTYQSIRTGLTYIQPENIVSGLSQVLLNIGINHINGLVAGLEGPSVSTEYKTAVSQNLSLIYSIINNGITAIPNSISYPEPLNASTDKKNAAVLLKANRAFIQQEMTAWLATLPQFSLQTTTGYAPLTAQQNMGYIVDAIIYDTLYGGTSQINSLATDYFWYTDGVYYYNIITGASVTDPTTSKNPVLNVYNTAFEYLESVMQNVITGTTSGTITTSAGTTVYPSAGNGVIQNTILEVGSSYPSGSVVTNIETLINVLSSYWVASDSARNSWAAPSLPDTSSSATSLYADWTLVDDNSDTFLNTDLAAYLEAGNVPINIEMGGNKSMLANDFTQVNDLSYGIVSTNAAFTEQVSTFTYYNHVGYWALNGGQVRSVAGANAYGDYGLRSTGADSTELPNAVNLVNDLVQTARIYKQGQYATAMSPTASQVAQLVYIIGYEYIPYAQCFLDVDHGVEGGGLTTYQISGITHTSVTLGQNVLQLTISAATGLAYALRDGQMVTLRTNTYVEFTNITNVKPVRPSTALQYNANLSSIYRVLSYNLSQATGEPMSTPTNAILQTANGFSYYTFTTDTGNIIAGDPYSAVTTQSVSTFTGSTLTMSGSNGSIAIGQVVGSAIGTSGATKGQATGYISPVGLTVTYVSGTTVTLSGTIKSAVGTLAFSNATQGSKAGDNKIAIAILSDDNLVEQINTGIYALAWNGRTHQVLGYTHPLYSASGNYVSNDGTTLTVNQVSGSIKVGQLVSGTGFTTQYVTSIVSSGVATGGSSLQVVVTLSGAPGGGVTTAEPIQFGFNINGQLLISATPVYNNSSVGVGVNGLSYVSSQLEAGSTTAEVATFSVPYSSAGTLPPVDSSLTISGYSSTVTTTGSSITGTTLTIGTITGGGSEQTVFPGMTLTGTNVLPGTKVISNLSGVGNGSTWTVSPTYASPTGSQAITLTNTSYDGTYQVANVINTTTITVPDVSKLSVGMIVSLVQTTGYVVSISSETITLSIPNNADGSTQSPMYVGQQIVFSGKSGVTFGGLSETTYYVTYVSGSTVKVSSSVSLTPNVSGTASNGVVSFTGSVAGTSLTVTAGTGIQLNMTLFGTGITAGTYIVSQASGSSGGIGVYNLSVAQTVTTAQETIVGTLLSFTTAGGNVPVGTIVQSVDPLLNQFVVSPACWIPNGATVSCIQYAYVKDITITNAGSGYVTAPTLTFSGGGAISQAIATATVFNGKITAVTIVSQGYGYTSNPTITLSSLSGSITGTTSGTNLVTVNSTSGLQAGDTILFTGTAGAFAQTVYSFTFSGYISNGTGSAGTTLTISGTPTGTLYAGMVLQGPGVTVGTTIVSQLSGTTGGAGTYQVSASQLTGSSGSPISIIGSVGGLSANQTYVIANVTGSTIVSLYIYGSTTSPILGTATNISNNALTFSVPGSAQLSANISQFASPSVTTTGGTSTVQLSVVYPTGPGIFGTISQTSTTGNTVTVSSTNGLTVGQQITFTGTTFGTLVSGHSYTIKTIPGPGIPGTITISDDGGSTTFVPSVTTTSSGSMSFYCPNFIPLTGATVSSYTSKVVASGLFNVTLALGTTITLTNGGYYIIKGNSNNLYNGIWACASTTGTGSSIILTFPYDPGIYGTGTTTVTPLASRGTGSAIGISKPFSTTNTASIYAGYSANTGGQITQRISLTRATGHDFNQIGVGGYNTSNVPTQIYGNPAIPANSTKQVLEEGVGRVFYVSTDENGIFRVGSFFTVDQGTGTVSISQNIALTNVSGLQFQRGVLVTDFSSDAKMTENASDIIPVQSAIRSFIDYRLGLDYGGSPVPNYQLLGPGYMALNGALAMSGQMNMGGNGIINMVMPIQASNFNVTNKGYVDTQDYNQNSIFKMADSTLPYANATYNSWAGGQSLNLVVVANGGTIVPGMSVYGGNGAFDGSQTVQFVVFATVGSVTQATITLSAIPTSQPSGSIVFTTVSTGSQLVYDAPSSTWKAASLSLPNNSGAIATTGVTTGGGTVTLTFAPTTPKPFQIGQTIVVSGVLPVGYNGIYTVTASSTTGVSYVNATTGAITTQGTIVGNTIGLQYNSASGTITTSVNSGSIVDTMVSATADIEQSKLLLNVPGATYTTPIKGANGTVISTISNGATLSAYPTGTRQQIQAANGLASFNSAVFTQTNGWVDLRTAISNATGIQLNKITYLPAGTIPYNQTSGLASPTAVTPANVVVDGNAISNSSFVNTVGVMTVVSTGDNTSPGGVAKVGGANTYSVIQVSQANPAYQGSGGLNVHAANSFIKSGSDGSVDVGILQVQGSPIITVNSGNSAYQVTFGFPQATTINTATFTGTINSGNLSITGNLSGTVLNGMYLSGTGVTAGTVITGGSGSSWTVNPSQNVASTSMTATLSPSGTPGFMTVGLNSSNAVQTTFLGQTYAPTHQAAAFAGAGTQTISGGFDNKWLITGNTQLAPTSTFSVGTQAGGGAATSLYGTLAVTGNSTFNSNVTMNGSTTANNIQLIINNGASTNTTTIDSATGNTYHAGTFQVGTTGSGTQFTIDSSGNTIVRGNLTVTGVTTTVNNETINNNETLTGTLSVTNTTDSTGTGSGSATFAGGVGIAKKVNIGGNTSITGSATFTVGTGASNMGGTLSVAGDTAITSSSASAFTVTGSSVFNNNVTLTGGSLKNFKITNGGGSPTTVFNVDSNTGNTVLVNSATLTLANIAANAGSGTPYTGTITGAWSLPGGSSLDFATGGATLYTKSLNTGGTTTAGTATGLWNFSQATTVSNTLTVNSTSGSFIVSNGALPAVTKFSVDCGTGNIVSAGSLTLTGNLSANQFTGTFKGNVIATDNTVLVDATSKIIGANLNMATASTGQLPTTYGGTGAGTAQGGLINLLNSISGSATAGMVLTFNSTGSYTWAYPQNVTSPSLGTKINTSRVSYTIGTSPGTVNGQTVFVTPTYVVGSGQLKVFVNGVRQDPDYDYAETTSTSLTFGLGLTTGDTVMIEVDGYISYDVYASSVKFNSTATNSAVTAQAAIETAQSSSMPLLGGTFSGNVSFGAGTTLTFAAGTTTVAPFKLSAGVNLTSPSAGSIEFNGTNVFYTNSSNARKTFASTEYVDNAISTGFSSGSINAATLTGTIPSGVLGNSSHYIGTTSIPLNASSGTITSLAVNISGKALTAGTADSANSVAGSNVSGTVANATTAATANALNSSNAYSVSSLSSTLAINPGTSLSAGTSVYAGTYLASGSYISAGTYITATGDITAYASDKRLKENFRPITNALDKVVSLNGVIYNWNEIANKLAGYDRDVNVVGLIAQEVEAVLPEAVKPAPFDTDENGNSKSGENYKTIQYEKVVPLLVEAIKEQQATIESLQEQINALKTHLGL